MSAFKPREKAGPGSPLQILPVELLVLICRHLGGRELRRGKGVPNLTLFRTWYDAAKTVFTSGLNYSAIAVCGQNAVQLISGRMSGGGRTFMKQNTRELTVRMFGNWWDQRTKGLSRHDPVIDFCEGTVPDNFHESDFHPDSHAWQPAPLEWIRWRDMILRPALDDLFDSLPQFEALEQLVFEALSDQPGEMPSYIYVDTAASLLKGVRLSSNITHLTLDTADTELLDRPTRRPGDEQLHICEALSMAIMRIKNVRIRMRKICGQLFAINFDRLNKGEVNIRSLVIKLHLPYAKERAQITSHQCDTAHDLTVARLVGPASGWLEEMASLRAGRDRDDAGNSRDNGKPTHGMDRLRISFIQSTNIMTVDCLYLRMLSAPEEVFFYEDDATPCWDLEERGDLIDCGPFSL
jgi:hypothetical protein